MAAGLQKNQIANRDSGLKRTIKVKAAEVENNGREVVIVTTDMAVRAV